MEANQDNDGPPAAAEGQDNVSPRASLELKMIRACRENSPDLLQQLIKDMRAGITSESCVVYEDEDVEHDEVYYTEFEIDRSGWTYLHFAAFYGHTECVRIILDEGLGRIGARAFDGSTPLMVACANLPDTVGCIKFLCEYHQDLNLTNEQEVTALQIAMVRQPDLEVVKLLVGKGADMGKSDGGWRQELMMLLFRPRGEIMLHYPIAPNRLNEDEEFFWPFPTDEDEMAEIAMYLANQGCVKGALCGLLQCSKWVIQSPRRMEQLVQCFLEKGAVLNDLPIDYNILKYRPMALSLYAKKSIIYLEGISAMLLFGIEPSFIEMHNAITVLLLQGKTCGIIPLTAVTQIQDMLQRELTPRPLQFGQFEADDFLPLQTLYGMTRSVPSLCQLARTQIRSKMAECGKFGRENLQKLALTKPMIDFVQLEDLGDGSKFEEIMTHLEKEAIAVWS